MRKLIMGMAAVALSVGMGVGVAQAKDITIGVSIPAADHGWTGGVVFHAQRVAKAARGLAPRPQDDREDVARRRRADQCG